MNRNNSLKLDYDRNIIVIVKEDKSTEQNKVEPRIMHVLKILVENSPNVVSRDELISEVWNNYGGADDALNQAISHIRKLLNDTDKNNRIIETVTKKGYRFSSKQILETVKQNKVPTPKKLVYLAVFLLTFFAFFWFFYEGGKVTAPQPDFNNQTDLDQEHEAPLPD